MALGRWLRRVASFAVHGGSWTLRDYEQSVVDALLQASSRPDADALRGQLDALDHLKRLHDDRMLTFYFQEADRLPLLTNPAPEQPLGRWRMQAEGLAPVTVSVVAHRGRLSSFEFSASPTAFERAAGLSLTAVAGRAKKSLPAAIDAQEHGNG